VSVDPNQQDLANREFEKIIPGLSGDITKMRRSGFQQVTVVEGLEFPIPMGYVQTGPSVFNNYTNQVGPGIIPIITPIQPGGPGGGTFGPGEGGPGEGGGDGTGGPGEEARFSCVENQCIPDPDGAFFELGECQESGCDPDRNEDDVNGNNGPRGSSPVALNPFMAELTSASGPSVFGGKSRWEYGWIEVQRIGASFGWVAVTNGRTSTVYGLAHNQYEVSVADNGGNVAPSGVTVTRLQYPLSVVPMHLDANNRAWFCLPNPLQTECPEP
jgi:hypothetical protein